MVLLPDGRILLQRGLLMTGVFGSVERNASVEVSSESWQWELSDRKGQYARLEDFKGKPIFLNFWATWCPPCNAELPYIVETIEESKADVVFLLVTSESPEKVEAFLTRKQLDIPVYFMHNYPGSELEAPALPTTFVIDADGRVIHRSKGMRKWSAEELNAMLNPSE
jgi:thiol-disulfide isomerase/thioredoxin